MGKISDFKKAIKAGTSWDEAAKISGLAKSTLSTLKWMAKKGKIDIEVEGDEVIENEIVTEE